MARDHDNEPFEWVNAWAQARASAAPVAQAEAAIAAPPGGSAVTAAPPSASEAPMAAPPGASAVTPPAAQDQLMRDIAEIARARDTIAALPVNTFSARRGTQALTLVPARTSDAVPVIVGGVLALVMLTVFGAAAAMTKLSR
jgi:hypothetical protein